jgi:hypothetical protein
MNCLISNIVAVCYQASNILMLAADDAVFFIIKNQMHVLSRGETQQALLRK